MSGMPYLTIRNRSMPPPKAKPRYPSKPTARKTLGCTKPAPIISSQRSPNLTSTSIPGSTKEKKLGRKRISASGPKYFKKKENRPPQMGERDFFVHVQSLHLKKLGLVGGIGGLITKDFSRHDNPVRRLYPRLQLLLHISDLYWGCMGTK